jgi:hypothetical protein
VGAIVAPADGSPPLALAARYDGAHFIFSVAGPSAALVNMRRTVFR